MTVPRLVGCVALLILGIATQANCAWAQFWPGSQAKIERALRGRVVEERRAAAQQLHRVPPSVARVLAGFSIDDPDAQVRQSVGQLVLARRYTELLPRVTSWLSDAEPSVRQLGARLLALGPLGDEQVALLARLLSDPVVDVRRTAASVLAMGDAGSAVPALLNHLGDSNDGVRLAVIEALGFLGSPAATLPLLSRLQDPNVEVRRASVEALGEIDDATSVNALSVTLTDVDVDVRYAAIGAMRKKSSCDTIDALLERLSGDRDVGLRIAALAALAELGASGRCSSDARAVIASTLVDGLGDAKQEIRDEALTNLRRFPAVAQAELYGCLAGVDATSSQLAPRALGCALALAEADSQAERTNVRPANDSYELIKSAWRAGQLSDAELLEVLRAGRYQASLPVVLDLLSNPTAQVRAQALDTAYQLLEPALADGRAVDPLAAFVKSSTSLEELAQAIGLLGHTGSQRAVPHLLPFARDQAPLALRVAAFHALGEIKGAGVPLELVTAALTAESTELRQAAARSVRDGEWSGLGRALVTLLRDATYDEVEGVANALWGVAPRMNEATLVTAFAREVETALPRHQDALIEAFGRVPWALTKGHWARFAGEFTCQPKAKVAETLGMHVEARPLLVDMLKANCPNVVLNALWSLRQFTLEPALLSQVIALSHSDQSLLSGNAVALLAAIQPEPLVSNESSAVATSDSVKAALCEGLAQGRWAVPALSNALTALRLRHQRCPGSFERNLLHHPVQHVRKRAARLIAAVSDPADASVRALDARMLRQCVRLDIDGDVAATCLGEREETRVAADHWITISVTSGSDGETLPTTPYALEHTEGWIRSGTTDRRGAVLEKVHDANDVWLSWL